MKKHEDHSSNEAGIDSFMAEQNEGKPMLSGTEMSVGLETDNSFAGPPLPPEFVAAMHDEEEAHSKKAPAMKHQEIELFPSDESPPMPLSQAMESFIDEKAQKKVLNTPTCENAGVREDHTDNLDDNMQPADGPKPCHSSTHSMNDTHLQTSTPSASTNAELRTSVDTPQTPMFYEVEATLVEDSAVVLRVNDQQQSSEPVYDAVLVPAQPGLIQGSYTGLTSNLYKLISLWRQYKLPIVVLLCVLTLSIGLSFRPKETPGSSFPFEDLPANVPTDPPTILGVSSVEFISAAFETNCTENCQNFVSVDGDTAVISKDSEYIEFLSKNIEGLLQPIQRVLVNYSIRSLTINQNIVAIGSPLENVETGAVYLYERKGALGTWNQTVRIVPNDHLQDAEFGSSLDLSRNVLVVGAYQDREGKIGSVYIYRNRSSDWLLEQKLTPQDPDLKNFGMSVSLGLKSDRIAIGDRAYKNSSIGDDNKGVVFIYKGNGTVWSQSSVIRNQDCDGWFGVSLAFTYDDALLIGCALEKNHTGAVYYYAPDAEEYVFRQKLEASEGAWPDKFGNADQIAVYSNIMVVGTDRRISFRDRHINLSGKAFVFLRTNDVWAEVCTVDPPTSTDSSRFGYILSTSENILAVSSESNVFFYELNEGRNTFSCISTESTKFGEKLFENDCDGIGCIQQCVLDGNTAVTSRDEEMIQFMSYVNGKPLVIASFEVNYDIRSMKIAGKVAAIGAPSVNNKNGTVILFERNSSGMWHEFTHIIPNDIAPLDNFGASVDIDVVDADSADGSILVVGAYYYLENRGYAAVFRRTENSWKQEAKLLPDDTNLRGFGRSVSVSLRENQILVGDNNYKNFAGAVFLYEFDSFSSSWIFSLTLTNEDCDGSFGASLAFAPGGIMIGCPNEHEYRGAIYYYANDSGRMAYSLKQKITASGHSRKLGDFDQLAVDRVSGVVAAGSYDEVGGRVYIFAEHKGTWVEVATVDAPTEFSNRNYFGHKVVLSGNKAIIASTANCYMYTFDCDQSTRT